MKFMYYAVGVFIAMASGAESASAYSPEWLQCDGQVVTTGLDAGTKPAHHIYIYDDDNRHLFLYSPEQQSQSLEAVTEYTDKNIRWGSKNVTISGATWEGTLDRSSLALKLAYKDLESVRTWTEQCKPTNAMASSVADQTPTAIERDKKAGE
jgi:hypothetical protein